MPMNHFCLTSVHCCLPAVPLQADRILFFGSNGTVLEQGTWDELVTIPDGHFAKFVQVQALHQGEAQARPSDLQNPDEAAPVPPNSAAPPSDMKLQLGRSASSASSLWWCVSESIVVRL